MTDKKSVAKPRTINLKLRRFDPDRDREPVFEEYLVPYSEGMSAMDVLDYIYQHVDGTIAYYDHAGCALGACARCICKINHKPGLLCQRIVTGDITLEPTGKGELIRDLVIDRTGKRKD